MSTTSKCDDCGAVRDTEELAEIEDLEQRVDQDTMYYPTGQCPDCGALCYLHEDGKGYNMKVNIRGKSREELLAMIDKVREKIAEGEFYNFIHPEEGPSYDFSIHGVGEDGLSDA